jgi:hypothetical protein
MKNCWIIFFFCMTPLFGLTPVSIEAPNGGRPIQVEPLKPVTTFWRITNGSTKNQNYRTCLHLPEKWKFLSILSEFDLPAQASDLRLCSFFVPQTTASGRYQISLVIKSTSDPSVIIDSCSVPVLVMPTKKLELRLVEGPSIVIAGDEYAQVYLISNESNIGDSIRTTVQYGEDSITKKTLPVFWLNAGEFRPIRVSLKANPDINKIQRTGTHFTAQIGSDQATRKIIHTFIQIVPRIAETVDSYHRIPAGLTLTRVMQKEGHSKSGFQADLYAEGTLDEEQEKHLQVRCKGPDIYDRSYFALHDEYFARYQSESLSLELGDGIFSLSRLMENYRYGRGFSGMYRNAKWRATTYWMKTRWLLNPEVQVGNRVDYFVSEENSIGITTLQKRLQTHTSTAMSLVGRFQPLEHMEASLEAGIGQAQGQNRYAYDVNVSGRNSFMQYFLTFIHADPDFPGYYRDTNFSNFGVSFHTIGALYFTLNLHQRNENINSDSTLYSAPQSNEHDLGLTYNWKNGPRVILNWIDHISKDRLPVSTFDYREQKWRLVLSQSRNKFNFEVSFESGQVENYILQHTAPMERISSFLTYSAGPQQTIRSFISYSHDSRAAFEQEQQVIFGISSRWSMNKKTCLSVEYQNRQDLEDYYRNRNMYQVDLSHILFNSHQLLIRGRRTMNSFSLHDKSMAWLVDYKIPFNLPVAKIKNRAVVEGTIINTANQTPVKDMIVQLNGLAIVTDQHGHFIFPSLKPGQYYLTIDCSRMGTHYTADQKMPMELCLQDGDSRMLTIGVSRMANLYGKIIITPHLLSRTIVEQDSIKTDSADQYFIIGNASDAAASSQTSQGLANCAVQLSKDEETLWRVSDANGCFSFEDLRPGQWTCKVYDNNLPDNYYIEKDTFLLDMAPGVQNKIEIQVLPKKRKIRMLDNPEHSVPHPLE